MSLAPGMNDAAARTRLALVVRHIRQKRKARLAALLASMDDDESEDELVRFALRRKRRRAWAAGPRHGLVLTLDIRDAGEVQDEDGAATLIRYQAKKLKGLLPGIGRGNSVASSEASRKRREVIHPYPDGIYGHCCNVGSLGDADGFRQMARFNKAEFDEFYAQTFWAAVPEDGEEPALLKRPWFFAQARNHLGAHSLKENEERRTLRGLLDDRDRVLCWLQMLRRDQQFGEMEALYGHSKSTFHNDFKDMTAAAQNMPCLMMVSLTHFRVVRVAFFCLVFMRCW